MATNLRKFATLADYNAAVSGNTLVCPNVSKITATGEMKYLKQNPPIGIGIRAVVEGEKRYYTLEEWNALEQKPPVGNCNVYVKTDDTAFVIHATINTGVKWSDTTNVVVPNVTTTTNANTAKLDMAGEANTLACLNAVEQSLITNAPLATWAHGLTINGDSCYAPACGQMEIIRLNAALVNSCRVALSQAEINFASNWWSTTQNGAGNSWGWYSTYWGNDYKGYSYRALAVAAL